jgi:hypothetical protein
VLFIREYSMNRAVVRAGDVEKGQAEVVGDVEEVGDQESVHTLESLSAEGEVEVDSVAPSIRQSEDESAGARAAEDAKTAV